MPPAAASAPPVSESAFKETKNRVKYQCRNSRFAEAKETIDKYLAEIDGQEISIDEKSRIYLRYVLVLNKSFNITLLGNAYVTYVERALLQANAEGNVSAEARLLYATQRITTALAWKDQTSVLKRISALMTANPDSFEVAKYFVKIHLNVPRDGFLLDAKQSYNYVKEAEKVNEEQLIKKHHYQKLTTKLQLAKIKNFDMFFTQHKFQQLTSQVLSSVGTKGINAPNVMSVLADQNSRRGDHDKAQQYIQRALTLATEVLDGMKVHKKYIGILAYKSQIAHRKKQFVEALSVIDEMEKIVYEVYGKDNVFMRAVVALRKAQVYTEMKGEEYQAEDNLKEYGKLSEKLYSDLQEGKADSCLNFTFQVELMSGFLKIMRPDKVTKIYKDIIKAIDEKDMNVSVAKITVELLSLQAEQDPVEVESKLGQITSISDEVEKQVGHQTIISLYLKQFQISVVFQQLSDFEQALEMTLQLIDDNMKYFEGNEITETLVDPYLIVSSIYM